MRVGIGRTMVRRKIERTIQRRMGRMLRVDDNEQDDRMIRTDIRRMVSNDERPT